MCVLRRWAWWSISRLLVHKESSETLIKQKGFIRSFLVIYWFNLLYVFSSIMWTRGASKDFQRPATHCFWTKTYSYPRMIHFFFILSLSKIYTFFKSYGSIKVIFKKKKILISFNPRILNAHMYYFYRYELYDSLIPTKST